MESESWMTFRSKGMPAGWRGDEPVAIRTMPAVRSLSPPVRQQDADRVRVGQSRLAPDGLDAVAIQVALDDAALVLDDRLLAVHQEADRQILPQGVVDAVEPALVQTREIQRRLAKGLGRESAGVDAGARSTRATRLPK